MNTLELDRDAIAAELTAALREVADPATYLHTVDGDLPRSRAAAAERAKAMTGLYLFEVEGLIRAAVRARDKGICDVPSVVHNAWLRWLQLHGRQAIFSVPMDGWLVEAFPKRLLTRDDEFLKVLGSSAKLGGTNQAHPLLHVPLPLLSPAKLAGATWGITDLSGRVRALMVTDHGSVSSGMGTSGRVPPSPAAELWSKLHEAFADAALCPRNLSEAEFPGH